MSDAWFEKTRSDASLTSGPALRMYAAIARQDVASRLTGPLWFKGKASCLLVGNVGTSSVEISAFPDARPDDGRLNVGVVTASGALDWLRTLSRSAIGDVEGSPFVETTAGEVFDIRLGKSLPYELDGGVRKKTKRLKCKVEPGAITVCVPQEEER